MASLKGGMRGGGIKAGGKIRASRIPGMVSLGKSALSTPSNPNATPLRGLGLTQRQRQSIKLRTLRASGARKAFSSRQSSRD